MFSKALIISILTFLAFNVYSQQEVKIKRQEFKISGKSGTSQALREIKYGDFYYNAHTLGTYLKALKYYLKAEKYNGSNSELNYKIGVCYVETNMAFKALPYLEKSYKRKKDVAKDIDFYLARAYQSDYKFKKAIGFYNKYKSIADLKQIDIITKHIQECRNGIKLMKDTNVVTIENLNVLNSEYNDYGCLISADGKKMFFTSRRPNITGDIDPDDDLPYEDIYISQKDSNNQWSKPKDLLSLNTPTHDDVVGVSHDGNTLILYKDGDLYYSEKINDNWTSPKKFPSQINSKEIESSACFTPDGLTLYFVRGKEPGNPLSNSDIYVVHKDSTGKWSEPQKLPSNVNSDYDEDGLFMLSDGKTLYFASKGHNSMGGYDIFKTVKQDNGSFSDPENLGYPINSPNDDIYFCLAPNKMVGYFTSIRPNSKGGTDIYQADLYGENLFLNSEDNLIAAITEPVSEANVEEAVMIVISGKVLDQETGKPMEADIVVVDNKTNKIIYRTKSNGKTGDYSVTVPSGKNYAMLISKSGYLFHSENFDLVSTDTYQEVNKNVDLKSAEVNNTVTLNNVFFEFGSAVIQKYSETELNKVVEFMKQNPQMKVEISGHTDNIGTYEQNMTLSKQRADAVANYLINHGISADRLVTKGYGYTKPIVPNDTPEHRQKNRRVEFKILEM